MTDKKNKEELYGWNEYLEEERAKGEANWAKAKESGVIIYIRHLEAKLKELSIENQKLKQALESENNEKKV